MKKTLKNSLLVLGGLTATNVALNLAQKAYSACNGSVSGAAFMVGGVVTNLMTPAPINAFLASLDIETRNAHLASLDAENRRSAAAHGCQRASIQDAAH